MITKRLSSPESEEARRLFALLSDVFGEESQPPRIAYLEALVSRPDFWAIAAYAGDILVGGLTAHALPMTRHEGAELFIYDIAVLPAYQRMGVGRALVETLRESAATLGVPVVFVAVDNDDDHALDFYRALGAKSAAVTIFTFGEN